MITEGTVDLRRLSPADIANRCIRYDDLTVDAIYRGQPQPQPYHRGDI